MFHRTDSRRVRRGALIATLATLVGVLTLNSIANADTTPNPGPDLNTKAALSPTAGASGVAPPATFNGAVGGTIVNIHIDGPSGQFFTVDARMCKANSNISNSDQMAPDSGNCVPAAFAGPANDNFLTVAATPQGGGRDGVDFPFRVGTGHQTWAAPNAPGGTGDVFCDSTHACEIWLDESVDTSIHTTGHIFKHYSVTYVGQPGAPTLASTPGNHQLTIAVTPPSNTGNSTSALVYSVNLTGGDCASLPAAACGAKTGTGTSYPFTGLTNGTAYVAHATATSTAADGSTQPGPEGTVGPNASTTPAPPPGPSLQQTITAERPQGALVLTQVCGDHGPTTDHPTAVTHSGNTPGTSGAPTYPAASSTGDPLYPGYPYPEDGSGNPVQANYPTNCNVNLGTAHLITSGAGKGQFYEATGVLSQVTVVDARDGDVAFTVNGQMSSFTGANLAGTFSGSQLGWKPAVKNTDPFTDSSGNGYAQNVVAGAVVGPNTPDATGMSNQGGQNIGLNVLGSSAGRTLSSTGTGPGQCLATATTSCFSGSLGIATLDADLTLWIPIFAKADIYSGVLTISAL